MAANNGSKQLGNIARIKIENEVNPDPAQYPLKDGTLVEFPDIFDMPIEQAEEFLDKANHAQYTGKITPFLKEWLSQEHYEALVAECNTLRKIRPVFEAVMNYYQGIWGDQGEGNASEN